MFLSSFVLIVDAVGVMIIYLHAVDSSHSASYNQSSTTPTRSYTTASRQLLAQSYRSSREKLISGARC